MVFLKEKFENILNKLSSLLPRLKNICVTKFIDLPNEINKIVVGENKISLCINGSIQQITKDDLKGVTSIRDYIFYDCSSLKNVIIPDSVRYIENHPFDGCASLTSVTIPDSVTSIGFSAFYNCTSLTNVTIPDSVTSIGFYAFYNCTSLTNVYLKPTTPPTLNGTNAISTATTTIHVPVGSGDAYKSATNWSEYADIIVEDIEI